jgi:type I restriction enzyme, S subunit
VSDITALVARKLEIWTGAIERKSGAGRGGGKRINLYGIERLRALILDLAVLGKLVPQNPADEPAMKALERLAKARAAKIKAGLARKPKSIASLPGHLRILPSGWVWTQLGMIAEISRNPSVGRDQKRLHAFCGRRPWPSQDHAVFRKWKSRNFSEPAQWHWSRHY